MTSLGIRSGCNTAFLQNPGALSAGERLDPIFWAQLGTHSLPTAGRRIFSRKTPVIRMSASATLQDFPVRFNDSENRHQIFHGESGTFRDEKITSGEEIDGWVADSVVEIVKNLKQAPLLVQVYGNNHGSTRLKIDKADSENWPIVMGEWKSGETPYPDGIIFVEELDSRGETKEEVEETCSTTKVWGVMIQGKGADCGPVCYLLKTSRAGVGAGLGLFCTHFVLVRVGSFTESALSQLTDCWLLQ